MASSPKRPKKTAQEKAIEIRQRILLDEEIEESEERFKALARNKLGRKTLLSGAPRTPAEAAKGVRKSAGGTGAGTLLDRAPRNIPRNIPTGGQNP